MHSLSSSWCGLDVPNSSGAVQLVLTEDAPQGKLSPADAIPRDGRGAGIPRLDPFRYDTLPEVSSLCAVYRDPRIPCPVDLSLKTLSSPYAFHALDTCKRTPEIQDGCRKSKTAPIAGRQETL